MTKPVQIINNYWLKETILNGNPDLDKFYKEDLIKMVNVLKTENKKYKEEKRLILKDIKEWIACAKNEELEGYKTHLEYWEMFETILRKIFTKYNTENISDDDLKYNHYLEKENENLILENKKYKEVINKAIKYINSNPNVYYDEHLIDVETLKANETTEKFVGEVKFISKLLSILKEVEHEKSNN